MSRLVRVRPGVDPGVSRVRAGKGFRYVSPDGSAAADAEIQRIRALVIPPAWTDVWIAAEPLAHIQAVGTDDAGRRQYLYHPRWRERRDRGKFARALDLAAALPHARGRVTTALQSGSADRERALAVAFRLLDDAAPRIGSARYLERHGSRGLTTLQRRHAVVVGPVVRLSFPAKSGRRAVLEIDDAALAAAIEELNAGRSRAPLLWYLHGRRQVGISPTEVNDFVRTLTGRRFTAKDFRTLRGTIAAAEALAQHGPASTARERTRAEHAAVQATAGLLGNTPAVARRSYIDPRVFRQYARGRLLDLTVTGETAILRLLRAQRSREG